MNSSAQSFCDAPSCLPFPLETYVCRQFVRTGQCRYARSTAPSPVQSSLDDQARFSSSGTSSSEMSETDEAHCGASGDASRRHECRYVHIAAADVVSVLRTLVRDGRGFVCGCKDFQCKPGGCQRSDRTGVMCRYLHLTSEQEAQWLSEASEEARSLRADFLKSDVWNQQKVRPQDAPTAASAVVIPPTLATPRIVVGGPKPQPCRQFLRGECFRGADCRFQHPPISPPCAPTSGNIKPVSDEEASAKELKEVLRSLLGPS